MIRYLTLITYTDQGIHHIGDTLERAGVFAQSVQAAGGKLVSQYWSVGDVDGCVVFEVPDEASGAALLVKLAKAGNVRTRTLRVFEAQEFKQVLSKI
jgi:uncharacterized protein with GYD domain